MPPDPVQNLMYNHLQAAIRNDPLHLRMGQIVRLAGEVVESNGPDAFLGEVCEIFSPRNGRSLLAEVIGFSSGRTVLFPYESVDGISQGCEVFATGRSAQASVGPELLGRVVDAFGRPLDGMPLEAPRSRYALMPAPLNPLERAPIAEAFQTGVRAIDSLLTLGKGQKIGLFAGSGVGKTSLLGQLIKGSACNVRVIALVGERGREVREFVSSLRQSAAMEHTVIVAATSDQSPLQRIHAAMYATSIAEYFRDEGKSVLLLMDSVTRFAMAQRELGLAAGEPPTARGYTPSVFNRLTRLVERCGSLTGKGSITGIFTVLVEGDDLNEPVSDALRATLDGHWVLTRALANQRHYPALDVLKSASRLLRNVNASKHLDLVSKTYRVLSYFERYREMIDLGIYEKGANPALDNINEFMPRLNEFLQQPLDDVSDKADSDRKLSNIMQLVELPA